MSVFRTRGHRPALLLSAGALALTSAVVSSPALAASADRDRDGMPNSWETSHGLNPDRADGRGDRDDDALSNLAEFRRGGHPSDEDTDNDGHDDGDEVRDGSRSTKLDDRDSDDDGIRDGDEDSDDDGQTNEDDDDSDDDLCDDSDEDLDDLLGTIESFDAATGQLVIRNTSDRTLTFVVTEDTEIEFDSSGRGSGEEGDFDDLTTGAVVLEVDLEDDGTLEEIELARPLVD